MAFCREVDDSVDLILAHDGADRVNVTDVCLDESIIRTILYVMEIGEVSGVGELVQIDDMVVRIFVDEKTDHMTAYEAGTAGNDYTPFEIHNLFKFRRVLLFVVVLFDLYIIDNERAFEIFQQRVRRVFLAQDCRLGRNLPVDADAVVQDADASV